MAFAASPEKNAPMLALRAPHRVKARPSQSRTALFASQ
jgi:hypothetical protein